MTSDTVRQKFIYNTPYDDNEYPLVVEDEFDLNINDYEIIYATQLYQLEENDFDDYIIELKNKNIHKVLIKNDCVFENDNPILKNASYCYIKAFVYLFKKQKLMCRSN